MAKAKKNGNTGRCVVFQAEQAAYVSKYLADLARKFSGYEKQLNHCQDGLSVLGYKGAISGMESLEALAGDIEKRMRERGLGIRAEMLRMVGIEEGQAKTRAARP